MSDWQRGYDAAMATADPAEQLVTAEILDAGGPDFLAGEDTNEPPDFHRGWDAAILAARRPEVTPWVTGNR